MVDIEPGGSFVTPTAIQNRFRNYYVCPNDGAAWTCEWSCTCNDRCPRCGVEIEPHDREDI